MDVEIKRDGLILRGLLETPGTDKYDIAILMHGFTGDLGYRKTDLLAQVVQRLHEDGIATIRFDFNGHGKSDGRFQDMTILNEISDGNAILTFTRKLPHIVNIFLIGHSQGGVVASMLAGNYLEYISKLVLLAPAATLKDDALKGDLQGVTYQPNHIPDALPTQKGQIVGGFYLRTAQTMPIYEVAKQYKGPVCLIHGDADTVVDKKASERYQEVYENSELHIVVGGSHQFKGAARPQALQLMTDFLKN
ncbi:alpha/beta hydrolase [Pediococcus parvulus]|uniref:alpha/beta hydrolase n=1 Tax=Pediococcus parvulus TaxID=54062 RepID=UPI00070F605E|nr:alpha/beta fold hydrolase [Pediococcus parvulus]MCT3027909.1 alpha/beta hydrolase [Pediococcus parvulus]GEL90233.1 alpha/beta hydrolase [Pediococcus parvulus]GHC05953.1 alpha/beta hydrolase [Pediococcus parvulus]